MKKNKTKYSWLLTPILACLMLTQASCSNDIAETTPEQVPGGTYLTIVTRGIVTGEEDKSNYEDYVGSLRVIAFKNDQVVLNEKITNLPNEEGTQPDTEVDLTEEGETILLSSGGGTYTFYFIANEEGHNVVGESDLSTALAEGTITAASQLEDMQVQFTEAEIKAPTIDDNTTYMLMSTKQTLLLKEGEDRTITIVLDRALAKAQLVIQSKEDISVTASLPQNKIPNSYYLIKQEPIQSSSTFLDSSIDLDDGGEPFDNELFDGEEFSSANNKYVSQVVYLPERAATDLASALSYSIAITGDTKSYSAPIADGTNQQEINYNIIRNNAYTTIGTYDPASEVTVSFDWHVVNYTSITVNVPSFN